MKISISNLAFGNRDLLELAPALQRLGADGLEIAPTLLWEEDQALTESRKLASKLQQIGIQVSGIQSLFFGHAEFQVLDPSCQPRILEHLKRVLNVGGNLRADVAVFGSPKNRIKGDASQEVADEIFTGFLLKLIPILEENNLVLTLEPNAPDYGADYLTSYKEVTRLCKSIGSNRIRPQIDTGCMTLVDEDICDSLDLQIPAHIHISVPNLMKVPGNYEFSKFLNSICTYGYNGWLVIEMLSKTDDGTKDALDSLNWLVREIEERTSGITL